MITLLKAAHSHKGIAILDIISPCVTFNNHEGSTKSYTFAKSHDVPLHELGYVPYMETIEVEMAEGEARQVELHDGSQLSLKKLEKDYDPSDRLAAIQMIHEARKTDTLVTGLLYYQPNAKSLDDQLNLSETPLTLLAEKDLIPGPEVLTRINQSLR